MRKWGSWLALVLASIVLIVANISLAYDFKDTRSVALVTKAWQALGEGDSEGALAYANKCVELYADKAKEMQAKLTDYAKGEKTDIFSYWALNDVATAYFIKGEAYRRAGEKEKAKETYQQLINDFKFGQCWDPKGWFWKPSEAAEQKIALLENGSAIDFSDNSSSALTAKAWEALSNSDLKGVDAYVGKCLELYADKAKEMQSSLKMYAWESKEKVFSYWALNDVGTCLYIKGKAYMEAGQKEEAQKAFQQLLDEFKFAQCWDPGGWFWKPAEDAEAQIKKLAEK